jgi:hypothetical protein
MDADRSMRVPRGVDDRGARQFGLVRPTVIGHSGHDAEEEHHDAAYTDDQAAVPQRFQGDDHRLRPNPEGPVVGFGL